MQKLLRDQNPVPICSSELRNSTELALLTIFVSKSLVKCQPSFNKIDNGATHFFYII